MQKKIKNTDQPTWSWFLWSMVRCNIFNSAISWLTSFRLLSNFLSISVTRLFSSSISLSSCLLGWFEPRELRRCWETALHKLSLAIKTVSRCNLRIRCDQGFLRLECAGISGGSRNLERGVRSRPENVGGCHAHFLHVNAFVTHVIIVWPECWQVSSAGLGDGKWWSKTAVQ